MSDSLEMCDSCKGSGWSGHPDSGDICNICGGSGGVVLSRDFDLIERLNKRIVWWESSNRNNRLYDVADCDLDQELADALEARDKTIAELVKGLHLVDRELEDHGYFEIGTLRATVLSLISQAQSKDKAE